MAISQTLTTSFKAEVLLGVHDFRATGGDTFKIALYTSSASLGASTTAYTGDGEVSGTGYSAGGAALTNTGVSSADAVGYTTFSDVSWASATFTARGALIYNTTPSATDASGAVLTNPTVCVLDFGSDKTVTSSTFSITFPSAGSSTAIIRVS
jgi:hypothetical protein